jgi:hypothetical protein
LVSFDNIAGGILSFPHLRSVSRFAIAAVFTLTCSVSVQSTGANAETECVDFGSIDLEQVDQGVRVCDSAKVSVLLSDEDSVEIPPTGKFVRRSLISSEGTSNSDGDYVIWVDSSGQVGVLVGENTFGPSESLTSKGAFVSSIPDAQPSVAGCDNTDRAVGLAKWKSTFRWWYAPRDEVSSYSRNRFGSAIQTWVSGLTRCSTTLFPNGLKASFMGNSSRRPSINANLSCPAFPDGTSVVGWRPILPNDFDAIGVTCSWGPLAGLFEIQESDSILSSNTDWYFPEFASPCYQAYDMQKVATHEFGHAIGLDHGSSVSGQVMDAFEGKCLTDRRRLGLGDLYALVEKYPLP